MTMMMTAPVRCFRSPRPSSASHCGRWPMLKPPCDEWTQNGARISVIWRRAAAFYACACLVRPGVRLGVVLRVRNVHLADEQLVQALRKRARVSIAAARRSAAPRTMPKTSEAQPVRNSSNDSMALMPMSALLPASSDCWLESAGAVRWGTTSQWSDQGARANQALRTVKTPLTNIPAPMVTAPMTASSTRKRDCRTVARVRQRGCVDSARGTPRRNGARWAARARAAAGYRCGTRKAGARGALQAAQSMCGRSSMGWLHVCALGRRTLKSACSMTHSAISVMLMRAWCSPSSSA
jgi:hypothetical protein